MNINVSYMYLIMIPIILLVGLIYLQGAMSYDWLEDGDPWVHAVGVKYIQEEETFKVSQENHRLIRYIDPYPPGYDFTMSVFNEIHDDMIFTLKFYNILFIVLGLAFFFFMFEEMFGSSEKAGIATFILACIPAYFSHFIWAHTLAFMFLPLILYFAYKSKDN